jgi:hypothetical protein
MQVSKLLPGMAIGLSLVAFPLASVVFPAFAQEETATVTIGGSFAEDLSLATGIPVDDLPETLSVPVAVAATVCGTTVEAGGTCAGTTSAESLTEFLDSSSSEESSSSESSSSEASSSEEPDNSAKAFAPGQLKGDGESAKAYAPGQLKGDGESAKDHAPGQKKKNGGGGGS